MVKSNFLIGWLFLYAACSVMGCGQAHDSSELVGTWKIDSKEVLENGHYVVGQNVDVYREDGTFVSDSRSKLMDGGTHEPLLTMRTEETGTWSVKGRQFCKHYSDVRVIEFESNLPDVTRDQIAQQVRDDVAQGEPECYVIVSVASDKVVLRDEPTKTEIPMIRDTQ